MTPSNLGQPSWFNMITKMRLFKGASRTTSKLSIHLRNGLPWPGCPMHESDILHLILDLIVNYGLYSDFFTFPTNFFNGT